MTQKKLENNSKYNEYDEDGDGVVTDQELAHVSEIKKLEHELRKGRAQRRMAAWTLFAMALYTAALFMPFVSDNRVEQLIRVSDLFYISGAGIVAAFFGTNAWIQRK